MGLFGRNILFVIPRVTLEIADVEDEHELNLFELLKELPLIT